MSFELNEELELLVNEEWLKWLQHLRNTNSEKIPVPEPTNSTNKKLLHSVSIW